MIEQETTPAPTETVPEADKPLPVPDQGPEPKDLEVAKSDTQNMIDRSTEENDRKERLLKREEDLVSRREALKAREVLGGKSDVSEPKKKEDVAKEAARALVPEDRWEEAGLA